MSQPEDSLPAATWIAHHLPSAAHVAALTSQCHATTWRPQMLLLKGGHKKKGVKILDDVTGVLKPVRQLRSCPCPYAVLIHIELLQCPLC